MPNELQLSLIYPTQTANIDDLLTKFGEKKTQFKRDALFKHWERVRKQMQYHTQRIEPSPELLGLTTKDKENYDVRKLLSKPISYDICHRGISSISTVFQETGYNIKASEELVAYMNRQIFDYKDLVSFLFTNTFTAVVEDPNGFLIIMPTGEGLRLAQTGQPSEKVEPKPFIVKSCDVVYFTPEWFVFCVSKDNYFAISKTQIWFLVEDSNNISKTLYYNHLIGELPIIQLGGRRNTFGYYDSFFASFLPFADELIRVFSDWQMTERMQFYIPEHDRLECNYHSSDGDCVNGFIGGDRNLTCPSCNGSGSVFILSPIRGIERPSGIENRFVTNRQAVNLNAPDPAVSNDLWAKVMDIWKLSEKSLFLAFPEQAQSGIAKEMDRELQKAFFREIGAQMYDVVLFRTLYFFERYLNLDKPQPFEIYKPVEFKVLTQEELRIDYVTYTKDTTNQFLALEILTELTDKRFGGNDLPQKKLSILKQFDYLIVSSAEEVKIGIATGNIDGVTYQRHIYGAVVLDDTIKKNGQKWFYDSTDEIILKELEKNMPVIIKPILKDTTFAPV
jgi:hypothetical protein